MIGKTNGNFCLLSNNFKQMVDLGIKTAYDVHDIMYGCPTCNELENGNLEFTVYDDGWCDALPVNYFTNYTFTNNGELVSINESNSAVQVWVEYFGSNTRIEHKISDYPGCYCDEYLIWYKSK